jgi:hypothetical protein
MNQHNLLAYQTSVKELADRLSRCPEVTRYDQASETEAVTLAHAFSDLEESFQTFLDKQLPRLMNEQASPEELVDTLLDIGEEFRHILYHIHDPQFYGYLSGGSPSDEAQ